MVNNFGKCELRLAPLNDEGQESPVDLNLIQLVSMKNQSNEKHTLD
jgi:hypothetical protein